MKHHKIAFTFVGLEAAVASALFLRQNPETELVVTSAEKFPERLDEFSDRKNQDFFIIGLGYRDREEEMEKALRSILKSGNKVTWFCTALDLAYFKKQFKDKIEFLTGKTELSLLIAGWLGLKNDKSPLRHLDHRHSAEDWENLVRYGLSRAKNFRDYEMYPEIVQKLAGLKSLSAEDELRMKTSDPYGLLMGNSSLMKELRNRIRLVGGDSICSVLILGETGTGKETAARALHDASRRANQEFVAINCANFTEQLLDSELFGYVKGAFTGAEHERKGLLEVADKGTLFLDEIGEMPLLLQSKLLRFLDNKAFRRVGGTSDIRVDVRIIAATNRDLQTLISRNGFRADLYYRLAQAEIHTPALREHPDDLGVIADHLLKKLCLERKIDSVKLTPRQLEQLKKHRWPGNVRELTNALLTALISGEWDFEKILLPIGSQEDDFTVWPLADYEHEYVEKVYSKFGCNKTQSAKALGIAVNTLKKILGI
ncbi:MAG: sigma-54 dependent transcriptional regulator [Candidatus Wallbacteria bacterium]|nr:sigma-54 dependent transcriptional regulator [Candidatus Wallbacteria bacterium]